MNKKAKEFVEYIISNKAPYGDKSTVITECQEKFQLTKDRSVYACKAFAVRFSWSKSGSFSNTILSLSHLQKYDDRPFFVVLIQPNKSNTIYLANSTFLSKVSHSSKTLAVDNIRGSFNGSDILKVFDEISNTSENFTKLYTIHEGLEWNDNLLRLVEASSAIQPKSQKFHPTGEQRLNIYKSIDRAKSFITSKNFSVLDEDLQQRCNACKEAIWVASRIDNVNIRGRIIEAMITANGDERESIIKALKAVEMELPLYDTKNELGDYNRSFDNGDTYTDIKTKVIYLDSAPKAYNVDKFLAKMSEENSSFFFFFIGIDENGICSTKLCSVYHSELIDSCIVQHHWAGRSTRGVVQFDGKVINAILNAKDFKNNINNKTAQEYLDELLAK
ncbi:MAG: hypothetical protein IJ348_00490 [Alistipes sp.]|nr:hypothetical protein [Alistipes sp.]